MYLEKSKQPIIWNGESICEVNAMEEPIVSFDVLSGTN